MNEDRLADLLSVDELIQEKLLKVEVGERRLHELAVAIRVVRKRIGQMILEEQRETTALRECG